MIVIDVHNRIRVPNYGIASLGVASRMYSTLS